MRTADSTTSRVRNQYEQLPYPPRNPADEANRLILTSLDDLAVIAHYGFRGNRNRLRSGRFLIAGGGTGDAVVFLATQLVDSNAEIVYVDLSDASMKIAQQRLATRGLDHRVSWVRQSIRELSPDQLGQFDYINCSGVLHHLDDPNAGLDVLVSLLKPDGLLGLMLYAKYGRTGIYAMQDLFRHLIDRNSPIEEQIAFARNLFTQLPSSNWHVRGADLFAPASQLCDTELVDLFLHPQDRAFSIPELYDFLQRAGLILTEFAADGRLWYQPHAAFSDPAILNRISQMSPPEQHAACEAWWGCLIKHTFWASRQCDTCADWHNLSLFPVYSHLARQFAVPLTIATMPGESWHLDLSSGGQSKVRLSLELTPIIRQLASIIDGKTPLGQIYQQLSGQFQQSLPAVQQECFNLFRILNSHDLLILQDAPASPS